MLMLSVYPFLFCFCSEEGYLSMYNTMSSPYLAAELLSYFYFLIEILDRIWFIFKVAI